MSYKYLYPTYPIIIRTPPRSSVRFGSRKVYVDLPAEIYNFMFSMMSKSFKSKLTPEDVRYEWEEFVKNNHKLLHNGRKLASVYLRKDAKKPYLKLQVNWQVFFDYLEDLSKDFFEKVSYKGEAIKEFYNTIWENYLYISGETRIIEPTLSEISIENFLKLVKSTGDYYAVILVIEKLEEFLTEINKEGEDPYFNAALTSLYSLRSLVSSACIFPCYVLIRNIIENITKSIVYTKLSKALNAEYLLSIMFFYEQQYGEQQDRWKKTYSPIDLSKKSIKKIQRIHNELSEEEFYYEKIINLFKRDNFPILGINRNVIEHLPEFLGLKRQHINDSCKLLAELYTACGTVIHGSALPFLSLLEFKFFKYFLEKTVEDIITLLETVKGLKAKKDKKELDRDVFRDPKSIRQALKIVNELMINHREEIEKIFERTLTELEKERSITSFIRPKVLLYLLYLISPSGKQIKGIQITYADLLKDIPEKLETISFMIGIKETVVNTFHTLKDRLLVALEENRILQLEDKKLKELVAFYLILELAPNPYSEGET